MHEWLNKRALWTNEEEIKFQGHTSGMEISPLATMQERPEPTAPSS